MNGGRAPVLRPAPGNHRQVPPTTQCAWGPYLRPELSRPRTISRRRNGHNSFYLHGLRPPGERCSMRRFRSFSRAHTAAVRVCADLDPKRGDPMRRRDFCKVLPGLAALPLFYPKSAHAAKFKITDVRLSRVRLIKDAGTVPRRVGVTGGGLPISIGGFTVTEVRTDQGLVGIGPGIEPAVLKQVQGLLVGQDPFDINRHAAVLYSPQRSWGAPVVVALWDLLGKAVDQPLYKLWGGLRDRILPYAAMWGIGTPEERAEMAARVKGEGWRAIKMRSGFTTFRDDVRMIEL